MEAGLGAEYSNNLERDCLRSGVKNRKWQIETILLHLCMECKQSDRSKSEHVLIMDNLPV